MIRLRLIEFIKKYDRDNSLTFEKNEIINFMREVFQEDNTEIDYVTRNVFRYDQDGDGKVTYDEFASFILEIHCG